MTIDTLQLSLKSLRMGGMSSNLPVRYQEARSHELDYLDFLHNLVSDELARRQGNLLNRRIKLARFPQLKTIEDFDFDFNTTIKKKDIMALLPLTSSSKSKHTFYRASWCWEIPSGHRAWHICNSQRIHRSL